MQFLQDCKTAQEFLERARFSEKTAPQAIELNFPAAIIQIVDGALHHGPTETLEQEAARHRRALANCALSAEMGMLQLGLLNEDINPGSSFISIVISLGWRYRIDKGFFVVTA